MTSAYPLSAGERRVIGCLIEKGATTPDSYPLTTNSLRLACNQSTSREPIVDYSDREIDAFVLELRQRGLARTISGSGHRVGKHRHVANEALGLSGPEIAVLAVMLLRGPQTVSELVSWTARYADGPKDAADVNSAVDSLVARDEPFAVRLSTRPGEREPRIAQVWSPVEHSSGPPATEAPALAVSAASAASAVPDRPAVSAASAETAYLAEGRSAKFEGPVTADSGDLETRVSELERVFAEQTRRLDALIDELGD